MIRFCVLPGIIGGPGGVEGGVKFASFACLALLACALAGCSGSAEPAATAPASGATASSLPAGMTEFKKDGKLFCPIMKHAIDSADKAEGYVDHEGVRYYVCCKMCLGKAKADPSILKTESASL